MRISQSTAVYLAHHKFSGDLSQESCPDVSFLILTFNSEAHIQKCISSIENQCHEASIQFEIIVVDNGSTDSTVEMVRKSFCPITLIRNIKNEGTTKSRNKGIVASKGKIICFLDSDTELLSGNINEIISILDRRCDVGIVVPKLLLPDGKIQKSIKKFPLPHEKLLKCLKILSGVPATSKDHYKKIPVNRQVSVANAISACWFFKTSLIEEVGFLDENIFYSPEDLDYCLRVWQSGKLILFYPDFEVLHYTQQISHKSPFSLISVKHFFGLIYFFYKHKYFIRRPKYGDLESN